VRGSLLNVVRRIRRRPGSFPYSAPKEGITALGTTPWIWPAGGSDPSPALVPRAPSPQRRGL
jgi:hypothetical protein